VLPARLDDPVAQIINLPVPFSFATLTLRDPTVRRFFMATRPDRRYHQIGFLKLFQSRLSFNSLHCLEVKHMPAMITSCPKCNARLKVSDTVAGKRIRCPKCKEPFAVPAQEEEEEVAPARAVTKPAEKKSSKPRVDDVEDAEEKPVKRKPAPKEENDEDEKPRRTPKPARPEQDDEEANEEEKRPRGKKKKKPQGNPLILWGAIGGVAALLLVGAVIGLVVYLNSGTGPSTTQRQAGGGSQDKPGGGGQDKPGEQVLKATDLTRDLAKGEKAMLDKYGGKTLTVEGLVLSVKRSKSGNATIYVAGHSEQNATHVVIFMFPADQTDKAMKVKEGSTVKIKGEVGGADTTRAVWSVMLHDCTLLNETPSGSSTNDKPAEKSDVVMTAADWHAEWKKDANAAKAKYKDKVIELTGTVKSASDDGSNRGTGWVFLDVPGAILGLQCTTTDKDPWLRVCAGSTIRLRGRVPAFGGEPGSLFEVVLVEVGPNPGIQTTPAKLTAEFAANLDGAQAKYKDKPIYLEGEVLEKPKDTSTLKLRGEGGWVVQCHFVDAHPDKLGALKPGSKVKVLGKIQLADDKSILLDTSGVVELR
jgi:predicted Zn finger-like uncharacterized protein